MRYRIGDFDVLRQGREQRGRRQVRIGLARPRIQTGLPAGIHRRRRPGGGRGRRGRGERSDQQHTEKRWGSGIMAASAHVGSGYRADSPRSTAADAAPKFFADKPISLSVLQTCPPR
ncbi:hypothetical protein [Nocardia terpenica]|uniref:hypothetical protein n=1 Tax=Nocardia terpenica TaxID=455432 RepID=UPI0015C538FE|nr:hypothetical protein [Nocardia terpenica]NQE89095.1 hypothetical protein [Nocardia terpenica]